MPNFGQLIRRAVRNVYLLINFGNFVDNSMNNTANPYVQLLSTTDPASAHADFVSVRENHTASPSTTNHVHGLAVSASASTSASASASSKPSEIDNVKNSFLKEKIPIIIASSVGGVLILVGTFVLCCTRNRASRRSLAATYKSYHELGAPAPAAETHRVSGYYPPPPPNAARAGYGFS